MWPLGKSDSVQRLETGQAALGSAVMEAVSYSSVSDE